MLAEEACALLRRCLHEVGKMSFDFEIGCCGMTVARFCDGNNGLSVKRVCPGLYPHIRYIHRELVVEM